MIRLTPAMRLTSCGIAVVLLAWATPALAHPAPFSYLDVRLDQHGIEVTLVAHVFDVAHDLGITEATDVQRLLDPAGLSARGAAVTALLRSRLHLAADGARLGGDWSAPSAAGPAGDSDARALRRRKPPAVGDGRGADVSVRSGPPDVRQRLRARALVRRPSSIEDARGRAFRGHAAGTLAVVRRFAASGVHHILIGPDHLLFLVGLLLLGGSLRQLVLVVTAFTLAHSVTLSLAALNLVSPPAWIVEPAIALSIVYVGADNLMVRGGRDVRGLDRVRVRPDSRLRLRERAARDGPAGARARLVAVLVQRRRRDRPAAGGRAPSPRHWRRSARGAKRPGAPGGRRFDRGHRRRRVLVHPACVLSVEAVA